MSLWHLKLHPDALEIPTSLYRCPQDTTSPQVPTESCTSPHPKPVSDALKTTDLIWLTPTPSRGPQVPRVPPDALKTTENPMCPQNAEPRSVDPKPHHPPPHSQTSPHVPPHPPTSPPHSSPRAPQPHRRSLAQHCSSVSPGGGRILCNISHPVLWAGQQVGRCGAL